jgi:hypothetical protein
MNMPGERPLMRYQLLLRVLIGVLFLASPASAGTYMFTWSEYSTGRIPPDGSPPEVSQTTGYGLITVTPSTEEPGGIEFTFSGPGGSEEAGRGFMVPGGSGDFPTAVGVPQHP